MPVFRVKAPDGSTYRVNAPEGATEDQAIEYVRSQQENSAPKNDLAATLAQIDARPQQAPEKYTPDESTIDYLGERFRKGVAMSAGFPVESVKNVINLVPEAARLGLMAAGRYDLANQVPRIKGEPFGGTQTFERLFAADRNFQPTSP